MEGKKSLKKLTVNELVNKEEFLTESEHYQKYLEEDNNAEADIANIKLNGNYLSRNNMFEAKDAKKALDRTANKDSIYEQGGEHKDFVRLTNALQHSVYSGKDSPEMVKVKKALAKLTSLLLKDVDLKSDNLFDGIGNLEKQYDEVITQCDEYIRAKNPKSKSGKARKSMVEDLRKRCATEKAMIRPVAHELRERNEESIAELDITKFNDILYYVRATKCSGFEGKEGKGSFSDVHKVKIVEGKKTSTYYFTPNTKRPENIRYSADLIQLAIKKLDKEGMVTNENETIMPYKELYNYGHGLMVDFSNIFKKAKKDRIPELIKLQNEFFIGDLEGVESIVRYFEKKIDENYPEARSLIYSLKKAINGYSLFRILRREMLRDNNINKEVVMYQYPRIHYRANLSDRNVATSRMAEYLGAGEVIAHSKTALIERDGKLVRGNIMKKAKGKSYYDAIKYAFDECIGIKFTRKAIVQAQKLQFLDYICGQTDRHAENLFVTYEESRNHVVITGVTGIDNDMSFGALKANDIIEGRRFFTGLEKNGIMNYKLFEHDFLHKILGMTKEGLQYMFADLDINEEEIDCMWDRITVLKEHLQDPKCTNRNRKTNNTVSDYVEPQGFILTNDQIKSDFNTIVQEQNEKEAPKEEERERGSSIIGEDEEENIGQNSDEKFVSFFISELYDEGEL